MSGCGYYRQIKYLTVMYHYSNSVTASDSQTHCGLYVNLICSMYIIVWIIMMFLRVFTAATVCNSATVMIHDD